MGPQRKRVNPFLYVVRVLNEFQGTFMSPGWCLYCNERAERQMQSSVVPSKCQNSLISSWERSECAQQFSATECLQMWRLRSVFMRPWMSVEPLTFALCVGLSSTCCCRASEGAAGVSRGRAFQFTTFSLAPPLFEAQRGASWELTSLVEVCIIARGLWPLSKLLSRRFLFVCLFNLSALPSLYVVI